MKHRSTATVLGIKTRAAQLKQLAPRVLELSEVIFTFRVKLPCPSSAILVHKAIHPNDMIRRFGLASFIYQNQMVTDSIKPVSFKAHVVIHKSPITAQLFYKNTISQALRTQ
jgi:hypothetical protein